jgi:predicted MFS family arabinose efflux permease
MDVVGAVIGLFLFYLSFEFTVVSIIPLMTEILPSSRATLMAFNVASFSLGRALGAFVAPGLYAQGILVSALASMLLNLLALIALRKVGSEV